MLSICKEDINMFTQLIDSKYLKKKPEKTERKNEQNDNYSQRFHYLSLSN